MPPMPRVMFAKQAAKIETSDNRSSFNEVTNCAGN